MSLQDALKDLRNVARRLDTANFNPQMNALEEFLNGIKVNKPAEPPRDVLEELLRKFLRGNENFSASDKRKLPFIIHESPITFNDTIKILRKVDFSRTSHLRNVMGVYLQHYDDSNKTELLRQKLNGVRNVDSVTLKKTFAAREYLFGDRRFDNMAKIFTQKLSVAGVLEDFGLSGFYKTANFIQAALKFFFRTNTPPAAQFEILDELDADFDTYENIFPAVADALIQTVYRTGYGKKKCMEIFYRRLGDPRFGDSRFNWQGVSQKSKDIFSHWLSEEDLEIFFELIRATALDSMWRYREKFWRAYLPHIVKTKIFLGNNAKRLAAQIKGKVNLNHGTLRGAAADQSVFVFQIGRYIFSEWSHSGKLRVQEVEKQMHLFDFGENLFEYDSISRDVLIRNSIAEWIHSSPQTYFWQGEVSEWLEENCGISKIINDWGLES